MGFDNGKTFQTETLIAEFHTASHKSHRGRKLIELIVWEQPNRQIKFSRLAGHFIEFLPLAAGCKFADCTHRSEPICAVRTAVDEERVLLRRYEAYLGLARIMENQFVGWEKKKS